MQDPRPENTEVDLWAELFKTIDQLALFTPGINQVWVAGERERFLSLVKEPCHTLIYDLGWTNYLPVSRFGPDDLVS